MKLISCYIGLFGNIKDTQINFDSNLQQWCEGNGFGKSTISNYIQVMFYGFPTKKPDSDLRERCLPFDSNSCTGNIIFMHDGKKYRIERSFGETKNNDTKKVFINDVEDKKFVKEPGEVFFGVDYQSFKRLALLDARDLNVGSTEELNQRVLAALHGDGKEVDLTKAFNALDDAAKKYVKTRGNNGLVSQCEEEIEVLKTKKANLENSVKTLPEREADLKELQNKRDNFKKQLEDATTINDVYNKWETVKGYENRINSLNQYITNIKQKYTFDIPTLEEVNEVLKQYNAYNENNSIINNKGLTKTEQNELNNLDVLFNGNVPDEEFLGDLNNKIKQYNNHKNILDGINPLSTEDEAIYNKFINKPCSEDIDNIDKLYDEFNKVRNEQISNLPNISTNKQKLILIFGCIAIVLGVILSIVIHSGLISISVIGLLLCGIWAYLKLSSQFQSNNTNAVSLKDHNDKVNDYLNKINEVLSKYGYDYANVDFIESAKNSFITDVNMFKRIKGTVDQNEMNMNESTKHINELSVELNNIFDKYSIKNNSFDDSKFELSQMISKYKSLLNKKNELKEELADANTAIEDSLEVINPYLERLNTTIEDGYNITIDLEKDITTILLYNNQINEESKNLDQYKKDNNLTNKPDNLENVDINELQDNLTNVLEDLNKLQNTINELNDDKDKLDEYNEKLIELESKLSELNHKHQIIISTDKCLKATSDLLKNMYLDPVKNKFNHYLSLVDNINDKNFHLNNDFSVNYMYHGISKDLKHLSGGELSLCMLCFRLALMDTIFDTDSSFVICDDLFMHLDPKNLDLSKKLIKQISKEKQIIYFTCHDCRIIK